MRQKPTIREEKAKLVYINGRHYLRMQHRWFCMDGDGTYEPVGDEVTSLLKVLMEQYEND